MRFNILQLLKNLRFHSHGKEITDVDILEWANTKVSNSGSQSRMDSFKVPFQVSKDLATWYLSINLATFAFYIILVTEVFELTG